MSDVVAKAGWNSPDGKLAFWIEALADGTTRAVFSAEQFEITGKKD